MIKQRLSSIALLLSFLVATTALAMGSGADVVDVGEANQANEQQAAALVQQFSGQLKPKLQEALAAGGPVHAIDVCATEAPRIAAELSTQSGWAITRVSSRNRNPNAVPDAWESAAIATFESQLAKGADPTTLKLGETTPEGYRFAKPQIAEPLCLTCHGQQIAPDVAKALANYYPDDRAVGYQAGQIRGIFSLTKPQ